MIPRRFWQGSAVACAVVAIVALLSGDGATAFAMALAGLTFFLVENHAGPVV